ncbi:MAG: ABC transporter permease [Paracoccaceae bacterium]
MDFSSIDPISLIVSLMIAATPILLAGLGELVVEKSGVLNLGVEGMMIIGAIAGFALAVETENPYLGMLAAMGAGAVLALLFGILTQFLLSNQVATGLALTLFGLGLAALLGHSYTGLKPPAVSKLDIGFLTDIPVLGRIVFNHDAVVYFSIFMVIALWWFLNRSRAGLVLRAVGESHDAAHSLGYNVVMIRLAAIMFGGAMAGLGGAYFSLIRVPQWTEGMTAGAGWIALALVVFSSWKPGRLLIGAYLFGGISVLEINLQIVGVGISPAYLKMTPYLVTIIVLVIMSSDRRRASLNAPASLGRSFHASH